MEVAVDRVGLMGHAACRPNVLLFLSALETILKAEGVAVKPGALEATAAAYYLDSATLLDDSIAKWFRILMLGRMLELRLQ